MIEDDQYENEKNLLLMEWQQRFAVSVFYQYIVLWPFLVVDVSADGIWCYMVLWVVPQSNSLILRLSNLKNRLVSVCPSCMVSFYLDQSSTHSTSSLVYLLKFFILDLKGLLHGNNDSL